MKAAFYQYNPSFGKKEENVEKVLAAVKDAEFDLLVLPEFFATGYQFIAQDEVVDLSEPVPAGYTTERLSAFCREKGVHVVAGLPEVDGNRFYNSAIIAGPEGFIGLYRKTHLFFEEKLYFSPGDTGFRVWDTKMGRIGVMICFDWFFPESLRTLTLRGAEVVAHPSNLVLPYCPQAMPIRCLENRVYAITANRTGIEQRKEGQPLAFIGQSMIVSPEGKVLAKACKKEEMLMSSEIDPARARNKSLNVLNDIIGDRRPEMYTI